LEKLEGQDSEEATNITTSSNSDSDSEVNNATATPVVAAVEELKPTEVAGQESLPTAVEAEAKNATAVPEKKEEEEEKDDEDEIKQSPLRLVLYLNSRVFGKEATALPLPEFQGDLANSTELAGWLTETLLATQERAKAKKEAKTKEITDADLDAMDAEDSDEEGKAEKENAAAPVAENATEAVSAPVETAAAAPASENIGE